jgi:dTDP-4-dehydrorhamnose reductase
MNRVIITGSTGMLGSAMVSEFSKKSNLVILELPRQKFNIGTDKFSKYILDFKPNFVINCSGVISHKFKTTEANSIRNAFIVNSLFPQELDELASRHNFRVIQIATDCVFNGAKGDYIESDPKDAIDLYGISKSLGEIKSSNFLNLRCSIIGHEKNSQHSLLEWFLSNSRNSQVVGYTNRTWNGITTLAFAKIVLGIVSSSEWKNGTHHILPQDKISKYDLLKTIAAVYKREDISINPGLHPETGDFSLATLDRMRNSKYWELGGYDEIPTIHKLAEQLSNEVKFGSL